MELNCAILRDLLPNYIEKLTSDETNQSIKEHLNGCVDCMEVYEHMKNELPTERASEVKHISNFLKKTKLMYSMIGVLFGMGGIGILVTLIVDLAVNHYLSWSLIVSIEIIYLFTCISVLIWSRKKRVLKSLGCGSIMLLPMLYILEFILNKYFVNPPVEWFISMALPISLVWLAIIWVTILLQLVAKWNWWNSVGIVAILSIFGSLFTNALANGQTIMQTFLSEYEWINAVCSVLVSIVCFAIGNYKKK